MLLWHPGNSGALSACARASRPLSAMTTSAFFRSSPNWLGSAMPKGTRGGASHGHILAPGKPPRQGGIPYRRAAAAGSRFDKLKALGPSRGRRAPNVLPRRRGIK